AAREELSRHFGTASPLHVPGSDVRDQAGAPWSTALEPITLHPVRRGRVSAPVSPGIPEPSPEVGAQLAQAFRAGQQRQQALLDLFTEGTLNLDHVALPDDLLPDVLAWISEGFKAAQEQEAGLSDGVAQVAGPLGHRAEVVLTRQPATLRLHSGRLVHIERGARVVLS
ncbi:MAG: hypothetical protein Q4C67_10785, partial [Deinococcus sp.]|nr:hypothetical protein [Deinococcus sp.]